jgi:porphobilinogen deaminase
VVTEPASRVDEILRPLLFMIDNAELDRIGGDESVDKEDITLAAEALERLRLVYTAAIEILDATTHAVGDGQIAVETRLIERLRESIHGELDRTQGVIPRYA